MANIKTWPGTQTDWVGFDGFYSDINYSGKAYTPVASLFSGMCDTKEYLKFGGLLGQEKGFSALIQNLQLDLIQFTPGRPRPHKA